MPRQIVDFASPILAAYFEGKRMRDDRENKAAQMQLQQEKLKQENEQFKAEQDARRQELADRVQGRKDTLDYNKAHLDMLNKQNEYHKATADSNLMKEWINTWTERTGRPLSDKFTAPMFSPRGNGEMPGMGSEIGIPTDFAKIPGRPDLPKVDVRNIPQIPYSKQALLDNAETRKQQVEDTRVGKEAALKSSEYQREQDRLSREYIARLVASNRELVAGLHGKDSGKKTEMISKQVQNQLNTLNNSKEGQNALSSARAMATVDDTWNRSKGMTQGVSGPDGVNLVMQYLQTVTPSNRITDFEFRKTSESDSKIANFKQKVGNWVYSGGLTPDVAKSLMGEIKKIHEANTKFYNERRDALIGSGEALAAGNGIDPEIITNLGKASVRPSFVNKEKEAPKKSKTTTFGGKTVAVE